MILHLTNGELKNVKLIRSLKRAKTPNLYDVQIVENGQAKHRQATRDAILAANILGVRL